EIDFLKPQFSFLLLRNGIQDKFEAEEFKAGDDLYVAFTAPVDGYIALFAKDDSIRCLLPAIDIPDGLLKVNANSRKLFFKESGERMKIVCNGDVETNAIYVLFSKNPIYRPLSKVVDDGGLPLFSDAEFSKWIGQMRNHDKELQIEIKYITIKNK
ncbi:MAG: DUF4384 domain-containing protein, partial [Prevotella sp.]|nr:DUF4384 domain-containing protein [Prevotella sp.]